MSNELSAEGKVDQVATWILEGQTDFAIREAIAGTWPDELPDNILALASALIMKMGGLHVARIEFLYRKQIEIGEFNGAMRAVKMAMDVSAGTAGTPVKTVEHNHTHTIDVITDENLEEHRKRLSERLTARIARLGKNG